MIEWLATLPHCSFYGRPWLTGLHLLGNAMVFVAYMLIPIAINIVRKRRHWKFGKLAIPFALFIGLCGLGHLTMVISTATASPIWYWVRTLNDLLTGVVSLATAIFMFKLIPTMSKYPTPEEHELMEETLETYREVERWRQTGKPGENVWT